MIKIDVKQHLFVDEYCKEYNLSFEERDLLHDQIDGLKERDGLFYLFIQFI